MNGKPEPLASIQDVSKYLGVPVGTLRNWITGNYGPPSYKVGKYRRYDMDEVRAWVKRQRPAERPRCPEAGHPLVVQHDYEVGESAYCASYMDPDASSGSWCGAGFTWTEEIDRAWRAWQEGRE